MSEIFYNVDYLASRTELQTKIEQQASCEHPNPWFSREICWCGDMHYFCSDCGYQVDPCNERAN